MAQINTFLSAETSSVFDLAVSFPISRFHEYQLAHRRENSWLLTDKAEIAKIETKELKALNFSFEWDLNEPNRSSLWLVINFFVSEKVGFSELAFQDLIFGPPN